MLDDNDVGISGSDYARRTARLIELIKDLKALGGDDYLDLPTIAVIGNQSAGKSSLVEAISGITVPRATGTCTRCPMECRLRKSDDPWGCQIFLRRDNAAVNAGESKEKKFGDLITNKSNLEEMIRRAQLAILNPSLSPASLATFAQNGQLPLGSGPQLEFSSDVVCLDITGPDVADLSFIDLPGIISYDEKNTGNIAAVRSMVAQHISKENTLILLTITMRDDINNQGAADLAHLADPDGSRTIGVLTKPDTVLEGEHAGWLRVLEGQTHARKLGYFLTKQPSQKELDEGLSGSTARAREAQYFAENAPWNEKTDLHHRFGTPNLTKELSKLLGMLIGKALPGLRQRCKDLLLQVNEDLGRIPAPPSDQPVAELLRLVTAFSTNVQHLVHGSENYERLLQRCRPAYRLLEHNIRCTALDLRPYRNASEESQEERSMADEDLSEESVFENAPMYLDEVKDHIQRSLTRELPFNVPYRAKVSLIKKYSKDWLHFISGCLGSVHEATCGELGGLVEDHFGRYASNGLLDTARTIVENQIETSRAKTKERLEWMLGLEDPPFTLNDHYFSSHREKYLAQYKQARQGLKQIRPIQVAANPHNPYNLYEARVSPAVEVYNPVANALSALASAGYSGLSEKDLPKLLGPDLYEEELIVMAETSAYFHVSYKRIIDNIPRIIDHDFLHSIMTGIQTQLIMDLALASQDATERASMFLAEDEQVALKRKHLHRKKERLDSAQKKFLTFGV